MTWLLWAASALPVPTHLFQVKSTFQKVRPMGLMSPGKGAGLMGCTIRIKYRVLKIT
jgi:hypothetical protein